MKLIPLKKTELQNESYIGFSGELVSIPGVGCAIHDGTNPEGVVLRDFRTITHTAGSNDPLDPINSYQTYLYDGPATSNNNGVFMGVRYTTILNDQGRDIGYIGFQQRNSTNASARFVVYSRTESGEPISIMYSSEVDGTLVHEVEALFEQAATFENGIDVSQPSVFQNNATVEFGATTNYVNNARQNFGSNNLYMRQNPSDSTDLLIEGTSARKVTMRFGGEIGLRVEGRTDDGGSSYYSIVSMPNLPVYADDTAAGTGGLLAGDVYRTSGGDLKVKL